MCLAHCILKLVVMRHDFKGKYNALDYKDDERKQIEGEYNGDDDFRIE